VFVNGNSRSAVTFVGRTENQQLNANLTVNFEKSAANNHVQASISPMKIYRFVPRRFSTTPNSRRISPWLAPRIRATFRLPAGRTAEF
jgi:hypothetical protein